MRTERILFAFGVLIAILPYTGFPYFWRNALFTLLGLCLAFYAYMLHREYKKTHKKEETFENFSENSNFNEVK